MTDTETLPGEADVATEAWDEAAWGGTEDSGAPQPAEEEQGVAAAGPAFTWAQFPWVRHRYGEHDLTLGYTLRNDGGGAGTARCHLVVTLGGTPVHVEDRDSGGAVEPGYTWDDQLTVPIEQPHAVYDVAVLVTCDENPGFSAEARTSSAGIY